MDIKKITKSSNNIPKEFCLNTEGDNRFLDLHGVEVFSKEFFKKVDELIDGRIIQSVNGDSSNSIVIDSIHIKEKGE